MSTPAVHTPAQGTGATSGPRASRRPSPRLSLHSPPALRRIPPGVWFVAPFIVLYLVFLLTPIALGLVTSFFNTSLAGGTGDFVGLGNYRELLADDAVASSAANTLRFTLYSTPLLIVVALVMALLTHRNMPARWLFRLAYFMPFLVPVTVVTMIWTWLLGTDFGLINGMLDGIGLGPVNWLGEPAAAMTSVVMVTVWWTVGFNYLLYLAALQGIPEELYEASSIDGANAWQQLFRITLPLLRRTTGLILVLQLIASLKVFDQIYLLTSGGPNFSTRPILEYIYDVGFTGLRIGYSSAISYAFFLVILVIALIQLRLFSRKEGSA
ncbi:carbohydrate ABC transporter permease [Phytoactinopolyspora halotolerans]|uniref:carbohydrate ABC transporter permease n=1 Tax=Phytoactinopolyspora halotolerans TaxID=1981512 RepID=UPI001C202451|nr:sugar ABC transporter permease [Phytoactinopolyspora halotolerans]